ncbi:MAG: hypothetical protein WB661_11305 [Candidatus Bathyarchaeia archaeon]
MRLRIATFSIFFVIIAGMPIVKARETPNAPKFIGYAQNEIINFAFAFLIKPQINSHTSL